MKRLPRLLSTVLAGAAIAATAACGTGSGGSVGAEYEITTSYSLYAKAVSAKDGTAAATRMSTASIDYYDHIRHLALDADRSTLAKQTLIDQLTVLTMRGTLNAALLRTASAKTLIQESVDEGLIGNGSLPIEGLQQVKVDGDKATAELVLTGSTSQYPVAFERESGTWKFDVTTLLKPAESALEQAETQSQLSAPDLVKQVLVTRFGKAKTATLYTPIGQ
jgi:hypothetical protein